MKHLTFANVMSCIAVFVALGGTSVAAVSLKRNSVGSKQIKRGAVTNSKIGRSAVTSSKVRNGTLLSSDFKAGQLGAPGPRGATGARGATGKTGSKGSTGAKGATGARGVTGTSGSPGAPGATNVVTRVRSFPLASGAGSGGFEVACKAGERAVGGGGQFVNSIETLGASAGDVIASSGPSNGTGLPLTEGATPTGWTTSYAYSNGTNRSIHLTAICASP